MELHDVPGKRLGRQLGAGRRTRKYRLEMQGGKVGVPPIST